MLFFEAVNVLFALYLTVLFAYLFLLSVAALRRRAAGPGPVAPRDGGTRFVFVIPAHNEQMSIRKAVESCLTVDYDPERFRVVVIADNCSDATALEARLAGAEVLVRDDPYHRSKGHALEYFFHCFPATEDDATYDAIVVVDADTIIDPMILTTFSRAVDEGKDWIQCYHTVHNRDASWRTQLMTYAFSLFNGTWLLGQERLGLSTGFRGNGMCFTARGLRRHPWCTHGLVEDMEFSWALRIAGERVRFVPETFVFSEMVSRHNRAAQSQCRRWDSGRKALRSKFLDKLLSSSRFSLKLKVLYMLELMFPPLIQLSLYLLASLSIHLGPWFNARLELLSLGLLPLHGFMIITLLLYGLSPILVMGLPAHYLITGLRCLPYYTVLKILAIARRRPSEWVRTGREGEVRVEVAEVDHRPDPDGITRMNQTTGPPGRR